MEAAPTPYIFVSYASADRARVQPLVAALSGAGIPVWFDREAIEGGHNYGPAISAAIAGCAVLVLACTAASLQSRNVRQEVALAWKYGRPYLPLMLETVSFPPELEYWLEGSQWIDVLGSAGADWLPRVLRALGKLGLSPHAPALSPLRGEGEHGGAAFPHTLPPSPEAVFPHPLTPSPEAGAGEHGQSLPPTVLPSPASGEGPGVRGSPVSGAGEPGAVPRPTVLPSPASGEGPGVRVSPVSGAGEPGAVPPPSVLPSPPRGGAGGEVRPLAGRAAELATLRAALDRAFQGRARLVLLAGEPGIGKTHLAEHVAQEAAAQGACVLWGRCWEGEGAPPFRPWLQALRELLRQSEPETLASLLGPGAADLAQLLPELLTLLPDLPPLPPLDPEVARFRLFEAVEALLRRAAARQPLVLVLDDLHWADAPSLRLLHYLAQELAARPALRLLVLATYRDVALDRSHPLAAVLGGLRREVVSERLLLGGLDEAGVAAFVASFLRTEGTAGTDGTAGTAGAIGGPTAAGTPADEAARARRAQALVRALHTETEGNPLFVQEILRHFVETGRLTRDAAGNWTSPAPSIAALGLPEGLREVIGRRLSALSDSCNQVLTLAAVLGREFELGSLARLSGASEDALDAALEEAERARVVEAQGRGGRYRFSHALVRETLEAELPTRRKVRLHRQAGEALEQQYARGLEAHLSELAYHFAEGAAGGDVRKAVDYSRRAGERALATYAYEEAVRLFEQALALLDEGEVEDAALRCDLLLGLAAGLMQSGGQRRVVDDVAPAALRLAERLADERRAWRACDLALDALVRAGAATARGTPEYAAWLDAGERHAAGDVRARLRLTVQRQLRQGFLGQSGKDFLVARLATLAEAEAQGDCSLLCSAVQSVVGNGPPRDWAEQTRVARQYAEHPWEGVGAVEFTGFVVYCCRRLVDAGEVVLAERFVDRLEQTAQRQRDPYAALWVPVLRTDRLLRAGRLREHLAALARHVEEAEAAGARITGLQNAALVGIRSRLELGLAEEALAAFARWWEAAGQAFNPHMALAALCQARLGRVEVVREVLDRLMTPEGRIEEEGISQVVGFLEAAILTRHREAAARLAALLAPAAEAANCFAGGTSAARHLSAAAAFLGRRGEALAYAEQALVVSGRIEDRPELALEQLQLAELLAEGDESERLRAREHLAIALRELEAMEMAPALARARRLDEAMGRNGAVGSGQ